MSRVDAAIRSADCMTVVTLAGIAGAISYSHMPRTRRSSMVKTGWRAHAFPLSVDGIEVVASLVLLADRRAGRRSGWLPWAALVAGAVASSRGERRRGCHRRDRLVVAGWPAVALLVAIKLLSGLLERPRPGNEPLADERSATHDSPSIVPDRPFVAEDRPGPAPVVPDGPTTVRDGPGPTSSRPTPRPRHGRKVSDRFMRSAPVPVVSGRIGLVTPGTPRSYRPRGRRGDRLVGRGRALTRDALAEQLRQDGHPVGNVRVSALLTTLRSERTTTAGR